MTKIYLLNEYNPKELTDSALFNKLDEYGVFVEKHLGGDWKLLPLESRLRYNKLVKELEYREKTRSHI